MKDAVHSRAIWNSELLYFLSAFAISALIAVTLANMEPDVTKSGYLSPVIVKLASTPVPSDRDTRFDYGG